MKKYSDEWKEYLTSMLILCTKTIEDNAEEIIGNYLFTGDLSIMFTIPTNASMGSFPSISVSKDYYPDYDISFKLRENLDKKRKHRYKTEGEEIKILDKVEEENKWNVLYPECMEEK